METRYPSISLLPDHGIIWVNPTTPWPSGNYVRNENFGRFATFIDVFVEGRLFWNDVFIGDVLIYPGGKGRNATEDTKDEQADGWMNESRIKDPILVIRSVWLHTGLISVTIL